MSSHDIPCATRHFLLENTLSMILYPCATRLPVLVQPADAYYTLEPPGEGEVECQQGKGEALICAEELKPATGEETHSPDSKDLVVKLSWKCAKRWPKQSSSGVVFLCLAGKGLGCGRGGGGSPPPPPPANQNPYFTRCPDNIRVTAPAGETKAAVTWDEPKATDKEEGTRKPNQVAGSPKGSLFEGSSSVTYEVRDSKDGRATCSFSITVTVTECWPAAPNPEHGRRSCSDFPSKRENIYGSQCQFTCDPGYKISGASTVTCQASGSWSDTFPTCEPVDCGDPSNVVNEDLDCPKGHVYPEACYLRCKPGYQPADVSFIRCTSGGQWSQASACADREKPKFPNGCPANQQLYTGPLESPVPVTWDSPETSDNSGGPVTVTSQPPNGTSLGAGLHSIKFTAADATGNTEICYTTISVQAKECPGFPSPDHGHVTCSQGYVEGSQCTVTCDEGYEVTGQATLTCTGNETWDSPPPVCTAVVCPVPVSVNHGHFVCTSAYVFQSECSLVCDSGYQAESYLTIRCLANATWSTHGSCKDIEPPVFTNGCPANIEQYAARLGEETRVSWDDPDVTDNSGEPVQLASDVISGSVFQSGVTHVTYTANDMAGNNRTCKFTVTITTSVCEIPDLEQPNRTITLMIYDCPDGHVYGAACTLNCTHGYPLLGADTITCERDNTTHPPSLYWGWPGSSAAVPECRPTTCPDLLPPKNGALQCFLGNYGYNCLMSCNVNFDTPRQTSGRFDCTNSNGFWYPATVPDCIKYLRPSDVRLHADVFYYAGNCDTSLDELRQNFIDRINNSTWKDACINVPLCTAENVEVTCGAITGRRKKRSTDNNVYVQFDFDIKMSYVEGSKTKEEAYQEYMAMAATVQSKLTADANAGHFNFLGLETNEYSVGYPSLRADCPPGTYFETWDTTTYIACSGCGAGYYLSEGSTQCEACPVGSYTELDNATSCTPCPPGWSTLTTGSKNSSDCKEQCLAGSSSYNGFVPCLQCSAGRFQPQVEAKTCELCPAGTWTIAGGSTDFDQCVPADVSLADTSMSAILTGQWSSSTSSVWISLEAGALARVDIEFGSGGYLPFSASLYTSTTDVALVPAESPTSAVVQVDPVTWSRLVFVADLENALTTVYHQSHVLLSFNQTSFTSPSSAVMNISVSQGKATVSGLHAVNRTLTQSEVSAPSTTCSGDNADNIAMWSPQPASVQIPSVCDAVDECQNQPCGNFPCVNGRGHFECQCKDGWSGDTCSTPPDACYQHNCQNGATCVPGGSNYTCSCVEGFAGTHCNLVKVDGNYGDWTMWTECSATCGGSQQRHRLCNNPAPQNGGSDCVGASVDTRVCGETFCPIQGAWSEWTPWGQCSTSCQGGARTRTRTCDNPSPQHGGGDCDGLNTETEACSTHVCPVHGGYGDWSGWTPCSVTCGDGQTTRHRTCDNPAPANGGNPCSGPSNETQACNLGKCPECAQLLRSHGTLPPICNETSNPYLKSCSVQCAPGYTSHLGFPLYTCGEETAYLWNNQRDASSIALLPGCQRSKTLQQASMKQHITMNADCEENTISVVRSGVQANVDGLPCVQQKVCSTQVQSTCVDAGSGRKKRSTGLLQLILNMTVNFGPSQLYTGNDTSSSQYDRLVNLGLDSAETVLLNDTAAFFTVTAGSQTVTPDLASMFYNTSFLCPSGSIAYSYVCVDCPTGYKEENGDCVPCPLGQYQDQTGSTQCKPCPDGLAWDVLAASSISQCILPFTHNSPSKPDDAEQEYNNANQRLALIVGLVFGAVVVVVFTVAMIAVYKHQSGKTTKSHDYTMKQRPWSASSNRVSPGPWADHDVPLELETSPPPYSSLSPVSARDFHLGQEGDKIYAYTKGRLPPVDTDM